MKTKIISLCGFVVCLLWVSCTTASTSSDASDFVWKHEPVRVDVEMGDWSLFVGAEGEIGLPMEAFLKVFAQKGDRVIKISSPEDSKFLDRLSIRNEKQALEWVRFFTRRDLFRFFDAPQAVEVEADESKITRSDGGFLIERKLAFEPGARQNQIPIYRVRERVLVDGTYSILEKEFIENRSRQELQLPALE